MGVVVVDLWTDGSGTTEDQPGGWAYVLIASDASSGEVLKRVEGKGRVYTGGTNNRMELRAVIEGFKALSRPAFVSVHTDSEYVANAFRQSWFDKWDLRAWKKVKNADLWRELRELAGEHATEWLHVRGHTGVEENERCDTLAGEERRAAIAELEERQQCLV